MSISIKEVTTKKEIKEFVNLQFSIYENKPYWVPPLKKDEINALRPEKNPCLKFGESKYWIVYKDNKPAGRIGAIIHHKAIEKTGEKLGRFTRLEFIDDKEVVDLLFKTVEDWFKEKGMKGFQGPLGYTNLDHQGMLIEGFDYIPSIASEYHLPYYQNHMRRLQFKKQIDWLEFRLTLGNEIPEKAARVSALILEKYHLTVKNFKNTNELRPWTDKIFKTLNSSFSDLFSVVELNDDVIEYYINRYMKALNTDYVKVVLDDKETIVGFIIGVPSLSEAMQKLNGKITLFNASAIAKAKKEPEVVDLFLTGVLPEYQSKGVSAVLINELQKVMIRDGVEQVETTGIFENNHKAIQHWKNYQHIQHKRKRCFVKIFK